MKKKIALVLAIVFSLCIGLSGFAFADGTTEPTPTAIPEVTPVPTGTETVEVLFSSPALEAAIREQVGKATGPILTSDVAGITKLSLKNKDIDGIEALAYCIGLKELDLGGNRISDITVLMNLAKLTKLDLTGNPIHPRDVTAFKTSHPKTSVKFDSYLKVSKFKGSGIYTVVIKNKSKSAVNLFVGHKDSNPTYSLTQPGKSCTMGPVGMSSYFFTEADKNSFAGATWVKDKLRLNVKRANKTTITKTFAIDQEAKDILYFEWDGSKLKQVKGN